MTARNFYFRRLVATGVWLAAILLSPVQAVETGDYDSAAEFRITPTVAQPDPGAFTATISVIPRDREIFAGGNFEPLCFRTKVQIWRDAENELDLGGDVGLYRRFSSGFWDGAAVRVYRPRNGKMELVRDTRIRAGGHSADGWLSIPGTEKKLVDAADGQVQRGPSASSLQTPGLDIQLEETSKARLGFQTAVGTWLTDRDYYFTVTAVDAAGRESDFAVAAKARLTADALGDERPMAVLIEPEFDEDPPAAEAPAAPSGVNASFGGGILRLSWAPSPSAGTIGYRVYVSATAPEQQRGHHLILASEPADDWQKLRRGDFAFLATERLSYSRRESQHPFMQGGDRSSGYPTIGPYPDEVAGGSWTREAHPEPLPAAFREVAGASCLRVQLDTAESFRMGGYSIGDEGQTWYPKLKPDTTYIVEGWARYEGDGGALSFALPARQAGVFGLPEIRWELDGDWRYYSATFTPKALYESGPVLQAYFDLQGSGTYWLDNLRVRDASRPYLEPHPLVLQRLRESGMEAVRFHTHIKSGYSQSMDMLTNAPGLTGVQGYDKPAPPESLHALLDFCRRTGTNPWLQVEMHMSEDEWRGLVEFLAAPYDPAVDSPATKPWAAKRHAQGQTRPWIDEFDRVYFEISNETWNWLFSPWIFHDSVDGATGQTYVRGATYGMFQEYVLGVLRTSPYWRDELAAKFRSVLGGWAIQSHRLTGYGPAAIQHSPSTDFLTDAGYNGGWDEGEHAAAMDDQSLFRSLTFWAQLRGRGSAAARMRRQLLAENLAADYAIGTYEAGPGYALPGLNNQASMSPEQIEAQDQVGKSQATGVSTLDAFLGRAALGMRTQNFFTYHFKRRNWVSHAPIEQGGHPYPSWLALSLYNTRGTGDFLAVETLRVPTLDLPAFARRPAVEQAPMVSCYATRKGDRYSIFLISRKMDQVVERRQDGGWQLRPASTAVVPAATVDANPVTALMAADDTADDGLDLMADLVADAGLAGENAPAKSGADAKAETSTPEQPVGDDGFTPVRLHLPFSQARSVMLYKISGDPRRHNLDDYRVQIQEQAGIPFSPDFQLTTATTGEDRDGLPPGSVLLYVFDGVTD